MSCEVTGPTACDNEGCAGWSGAEPQAWGTGHDERYALRWIGYRQEGHRCGGGRRAARRGGEVVGSNDEHAGRGRAAGQEAGPRRPRAGDVLRGGAVRLRAVPPTLEQTRRDLPGGCAIDDTATARRAGQDEPARCAEAGQALAGARAHRGVGAGRRSRGDAGSGAGARDGGVGADALPPAHRQLPAAPGDCLSGQAVDQEAPGMAEHGAVRAGGASVDVRRAAAGAGPGAGAARSADRPYARSGAPLVAGLAGRGPAGAARLRADQRRRHRRRDRRSAALHQSAPADGLCRPQRQRVVDRRHGVARPADQDRQQAGAPGADRGGLDLRLAGQARQAGRARHARGGSPDRRQGPPPAVAPLSPPGEARQAQAGGDRRRRPRVAGLHLGHRPRRRAKASPRQHRDRHDGGFARHAEIYGDAQRAASAHRCKARCRQAAPAGIDRITVSSRPAIPRQGAPQQGLPPLRRHRPAYVHRHVLSSPTTQRGEPTHDIDAASAWRQARRSGEPSSSSQSGSCPYSRSGRGSPATNLGRVEANPRIRDRSTVAARLASRPMQRRPHSQHALPRAKKLVPPLETGCVKGDDHLPDRDDGRAAGLSRPGNYRNFRKTFCNGGARRSRARRAARASSTAVPASAFARL